MIKAGINAVLDADQIVVTPFFHHTTSFHHHDAICIDHRGKTMGNHDCGAVLHDAFQRLLDPLLRFVVEGGSRFVEQENRRIAHDGASDRDALALAARKRHAVFADRRVVALRLLQDEFMRMGKFRRLDDFLIRRVRAAIADIVGNGAFKQIGLLRDIGDGMAQRLLLDLCDILSVEQDLAAVEILEALDKIDERRFARA